jgi:Flp pilus assembly protein TadD
MVYFYRQEYDRALADVNKAIMLSPSPGWLYALRGAIYANKGDKIKSDADYAEANRRDPSLGK